MSKSTKKLDDLSSAEAVGHIKSMPEMQGLPQEADIVDDSVIDDPDTFRMAIGNAQMEEREWIEIGERLFKHLVRNNKTEYFTYGSPGVKVFLKGTRKEIMQRERMTSDDYHEYITKKKSQEYQEKLRKDLEE